MAATMSTQFSNPKMIAEAGEKIYREKFQKNFETNHAGEFVAINVNNGEAILGSTPEAALEKARAQDPQGVFHLIRVGFPSAFQISHARSESSDPDWIFG